jgi:membrane-associated protease RseP (regulator of RpoE activity)
MWPDWVIAFVGDGRIALLALAVIGLEALVIVVFMRSRARVGSLILTMASGAGLLGALYAALSGASAGTIAVWLVLSLLAHASDMGMRLFRNG